MSIDVAVIPVAGLGTRWLPVTRSVPKELLPVWRHTAASFAVREAIDAGAREIVFVTSPGKTEVAEHFQPDPELSDTLAERGRAHLLEPLAELWPQITVTTATQAHPRGLGHAVLCARERVGDRPFLLLLPDEILVSTPSASRALVDRFVAEDADAAILLMHVPREHTRRYGIAALHPEDPERITALVEKPEPAHAPSQLAIIGRYVLPSETFGFLEHVTPGHGGEIQLTDALAALARERHCLGPRFDGLRHDAGQPPGLLLASVELALRDPDHRDTIRDALTAMLEACKT